MAAIFSLLSSKPGQRCRPHGLVPAASSLMSPSLYIYFSNLDCSGRGSHHDEPAKVLSEHESLQNQRLASVNLIWPVQREVCFWGCKGDVISTW